MSQPLTVSSHQQKSKQEKKKKNTHGQQSSEVEERFEARRRPPHHDESSPTTASNNNDTNNNENGKTSSASLLLVPLSEDQTFLVQCALRAHAQRNELQRNQLLGVLFPGLVVEAGRSSSVSPQQLNQDDDRPLIIEEQSGTKTRCRPSREQEEEEEEEETAAPSVGSTTDRGSFDFQLQSAPPPAAATDSSSPPRSDVETPHQHQRQQQVNTDNRSVRGPQQEEKEASPPPPSGRRRAGGSNVVPRPPVLCDDDDTGTVTITTRHHSQHQKQIVSPQKKKEEGGGQKEGPHPKQQQQQQIPPRRLVLPQLCNADDSPIPQNANEDGGTTVIGLPQFTKEHHHNHSHQQQQKHHQPTNPVIVVERKERKEEDKDEHLHGIQQHQQATPAAAGSLPEPHEGNERSMLHAISAVFGGNGASTTSGSGMAASTSSSCPLSPHHNAGSGLRLNETTPGIFLLQHYQQSASLNISSSTSASTGSSSFFVNRSSSPLLRRMDECTTPHQKGLRRHKNDNNNASSTSSVFSTPANASGGGDDGNDMMTPSSSTASSSSFVHRAARQTQFNGKWCLNDRFVFVKMIGRGGQGSVWKALDLARTTPIHEHFVAIKIVRRNKFENRNSTAPRASSSAAAAGPLNGNPKEPVCPSVPHAPRLLLPYRPSNVSPTASNQNQQPVNDDATVLSTTMTEAPYSHRVQLLVEAYRCPSATGPKGEEEEEPQTGKDDDGDTPQSPPPPTTPATKKNGEEISLTLVAETLVGLLRHENLLGLEEIIDDPSKSEYVFLVTRLLNPPPCTIIAQGRTREGALRPTIVARYALDLAKALEQLHSCGIVHCDVKPDNFLRDDNGHLVLADFGLSRVGDEQYTVIGGGNGTFAFWAPELYHAARARKRIPHSPASDCFALGVCLYIMLHGAMPYWTDDVQNPRAWRRANPCCSAKGQRSLPQPPGPSLLDDKERRAFVFVAQAIDRLTQTDPKQRLDAAALVRSAAEVGI